jgi:hypothetical protein
MSRVKKDINYLKMSAQLGWTALEGDSKWHAMAAHPNDLYNHSIYGWHPAYSCSARF